METLIVFDSKFGNSKKVAESIGDGLKPYSKVRLVGLDIIFPQDLGSVDLLIVGGPTQGHGISPRMRKFTDGLQAGSGTATATFDTRFRLPAFITGSAAQSIAGRLRRAGVQVFVRPESFFVTRRGTPVLEPGEAKRAAAWGKQLANHLLVSKMCAA